MSFALRLNHLQAAHTYICEQARVLYVYACVDWIVLNSVDLIVLSAQFVPKISADSSVGVKCSAVYPYTDSGTCTVAWLVCSYRKISLVYWALLGDIIEKHEIIY